MNHRSALLFSLFLILMLPCITGEGNLTVGFIQTYALNSIVDISGIGHSELAGYLSQYYDVVPVNAPLITGEELEPFSVCVLFSPQSRLGEEEIEAIHSYVERGGRILVTSEGWVNDLLLYVNDITEEWGFVFMNTRVYEPEQFYTDYGVSVSQYTVAALGIIQTNPIASRFTYPYIMKNSCTINITNRSLVNPSITLTGYAYGEHYRHQDLKPDPRHGEPVARDAVVMVNGVIGEGRVVGMGGHEFCMNKYIYSHRPAQNAETMLFALDWLTGYIPEFGKWSPLLLLLFLPLVKIHS